MATNPLAQEMTPAPAWTQVCLLFPENTQQEEQGYNHQVFVEPTRKHFKISLQQRPIVFHTFGRLASSNIFLPQESWKMLSVPGKYHDPVACTFLCDCPCERRASAQLSLGKPSKMGRVGWDQHLPASPASSQRDGLHLCSLLSSQGQSSGTEGNRAGCAMSCCSAPSLSTRRGRFAIAAAWGNPRQGAPAKFWHV